MVRQQGLLWSSITSELHSNFRLQYFFLVYGLITNSRIVFILGQFNFFLFWLWFSLDSPLSSGL
jgi:hypothetical protein